MSLVCVSCFMLERGVRIPALMSWLLVLCRGSDTRALRSFSLWESAVSSSLGTAHSCPRVFCCVARSSCFLISYMFVSCFAHGWWFVCWPCACVFVLCEHMASVLVFCVPCALMSVCLDPTCLVTCLLINFLQLLSLVTLLICSLYNLLVLAVPGWVSSFDVCLVSCLVLPCLPASLFFPYGVIFVCFIYYYYYY